MFEKLIKVFRATPGAIRWAARDGDLALWYEGSAAAAAGWLAELPADLAEPDQRRWQVLAQWAAEGRGWLDGDALRVPMGALYLADGGDLRALALAPACDRRFRLFASGTLNEPTFGLTLEVRTPDGEREIGLKRQACFLTDGHRSYFLSGAQHELLAAVEAFAGRGDEGRGYDAQLLAFAHLKAAAQQAGASLDMYLEKETTRAPGALTIAVVEPADGVLEVQPEVAGVPPAELGRVLDTYHDVPGVLTLQKPDGARERLVFSPEVREGLRQVKRVRRLKGEARAAFLACPQAFLDAGLIDLEDFSDRVKGIGQFQVRYYPLIRKSERSWVPEAIGLMIESDDPAAEPLQLAFENLAEFAPVQAAYQEAADRQASSFEWAGHQLPIHGDTEPTLQAVGEALAMRDRHREDVQAEPPPEPAPPAEAPPEPEEDQRGFLLIHANEDDAEYSEAAPTPAPEALIAPPRALKAGVRLLPHQAEGFAWLHRVYTGGGRGVLLADDMGLGKTLQVLAFMAWYAENVPAPRPILVVAPVALLENWRDEYAKFLEPVFGPALELHGGRLAGFKLQGASGREYDHGGRRLLDAAAIAEHRLVLTTYEAVRDYQFSLAGIHWGVVVTDEAQKIKTPAALMTNAAKALKTDFRIVVTGTPVENSLVDLWCLMDFAQPGLLGSLKAFRGTYDQPRDRATDGGAGVATALREQMGSTFLRRLKVDILKDLPTRSEHDVPIAMSALQVERYLELTERYRAGAKKQGAILGLLHKLRDLSCHPALLEDEEPRPVLARLEAESPKLAWVLAKLREIQGRGEKCILFTEDRRLQRVLAQLVHAAFGFTPAIVNGEVAGTGSGVTRKSLLDAYQARPGFHVIVLSPIAVGFGLTITAANHVIHVTRVWNPAKEDQATDRVHRIGQTRDVEIYYPASIDQHRRFTSFDEILGELLGRKRALARQVLFPSGDLGIGPETLGNLLLGGAGADEARPLDSSLSER